MAQRIGVIDAIKKVFGFGNSLPDEKAEVEDSIVDLTICPKCKHEMRVLKNMEMDFTKILIYRCNHCGCIDEYQFDTLNTNLLKRITFYDQFQTSASSFTEHFGVSSYNGFALDALWEVCGELCFPILCKTDMSENVQLVFVRLNYDTSNSTTEGFIITDSGVLGEVSFHRGKQLSYFMNPYLSRLPYQDFGYATIPSAKHEYLASILPVRYNHIVNEHETVQGIYVHELTFIEDFSMQCFGLEVYVKFFSKYAKSTASIKELVKAIDLESIVLGENDSRAEDGISINSHRLAKISNYFVTSHNIGKDMRKKFFKDIEQLCKYI